MKFFCAEVLLYFNKSFLQFFWEYCCHVWASALNCYMEAWGSCRNGYVGQLLLKILPVQVCLMGITLEEMFIWTDRIVPSTFSRGASSYCDMLDDFSVHCLMLKGRMLSVSFSV